MRFVRRTEQSLWFCEQHTYETVSDLRHSLHIIQLCVTSEQTYLFSKKKSWTGELLHQSDLEMKLSLNLPCARLHMNKKKRPRVKEKCCEKWVYDDIDVILTAWIS